MRRAFSTLAVLVALAFSAARAEAAFTITLSSTSPSGSNTSFNYTATIAAGDLLRAGDFFRVYDFAGYVAGTIAAPTGWSASTAQANPVPPPDVILRLGDDPAIPNLIFTYTGPTTILGPQAITGFSAVSTLTSNGAVKNFAGRVSSASSDSPNDSAGAVGVPGAAVPEPASVVLLGLGGLGVLGLSGRFRRNARA